MENEILLGGTVESCQVRQHHIDLLLSVQPSPDLPLAYLGPQLISVQIPDSVMPPLPFPIGAHLRVRGQLVGNSKPRLLSDIIAEVAPGLDEQIDWPFDPSTIKHDVTYSYVLARSVVLREQPDDLNYAVFEGQVVSKPKNEAWGRTHLRIVNYPDFPIGYEDEAGTRALAVYATISGERGLFIEQQKRIRVRDAMLCTFDQTLTLGWLFTFHNLSVVWPRDFQPNRVGLTVTNLVVAADRVFEVEAVRVHREVTAPERANGSAVR